TMPGSRNYAVSWTDQSGNFWLFGGYGLASSSTDGELNDLWKFDGSSWTWVSGANVINQNGIYGVEGVPSGTNCPGSRYASASWIDKQGALWLFGGYGYDINGDLGNLNDLWKFDGSNWTWISGANVVDQPGMYGNQGVAQGTNQPGARYGAASWADAGGSFWFFGGAMYSAATGTNDYFNDLWKYDGSNWTLMSGGNTPNQAGVYGSQGTAASTNAPRARSASVSWIDRQGNLWLFGGESFDPVNTTCQLNDMWKYDGVNWTWMTGSDAANQGGVYGQPNTIAPGFIPGAREGAIAWMDN